MFTGTASISVRLLTLLGEKAERLDVSRTDLIEELVRGYAGRLKRSALVHPKELRVQRTIRLTPKSAARFDRACERLGVSRSVVIETLIHQHLSDVQLASVREKE